MSKAGDMVLGLAGLGVVVYLVTRSTPADAAATSGSGSGSGTTGSAGHSSGSVPSVPTSASPQQRLSALQHDTAVSLPGLGASQVGRLQLLAKGFAGAIAGVLANGVLQLNPTNTEVPGLLANLVPGQFPGVSIPGVSAAQMGQLITLAREGQLQGLTARGTPILTASAPASGSGANYVSAACRGRTWSVGSSGPCVVTIQELLNQSGALHTALATDGQYGPLTEFGVRVFQQDHGIAVTGMVDGTTWSALIGG